MLVDFTVKITRGYWIFTVVTCSSILEGLPLSIFPSLIWISSYDVRGKDIDFIACCIPNILEKENILNEETLTFCIAETMPLHRESAYFSM